MCHRSQPFSCAVSNCLLSRIMFWPKFSQPRQKCKVVSSYHIVSKATRIILCVWVCINIIIYCLHVLYIIKMSIAVVLWNQLTSIDINGAFCCFQWTWASLLKFAAAGMRTMACVLSRPSSKLQGWTNANIRSRVSWGLDLARGGKCFWLQNYVNAWDCR